MRRTIDGAAAPGWSGARIAAVLAVALVIGAAGADGPARVDRVGQRVVARAGALTLRDDRDAIAGVGDEDRIYRVERVDGPRLWLRAEGKDLGGWAPAGEVVALSPPDDPAVRPVYNGPRGGVRPVIRHSLGHLDSNVRLRHAYAAFGRKDYDRAVAECTRAIRLEPRAAEAYDLRGNTYAAMGRMDQALIDLDEAMRLSPRNPATLVARGEVRLALKDYDRALADLDEAIRLGYRDATAYLDRGEVRLGRGDLVAALADLDEAIRRDPWMAMAYVHRATIRAREGDPGRALADLEHAIGIDPLGEAAYNHLAWLRATCPDPKYRDGRRAVEAARRACELSHWGDPGELETLAASYAQAGDFDAAARWESGAIAMLADEKAKSRAEARLMLYRARKPYIRSGK